MKLLHRIIFYKKRNSVCTAYLKASSFFLHNMLYIGLLLSLFSMSLKEEKSEICIR